MKVLLVDDEKKFTVMLAKRLMLRGFDVDFTYTGEEAIQRAAKNRFDVAILDVKMPGIGGIELERKIKQMIPGIKIIFLTGHGSKNDFETGSLEAAYYLPKPLQIDELIKILHEVSDE